MATQETETTKITIKYDADIDIKIITHLSMSKNNTSNYTTARQEAGCSQFLFEEHVANLAKWKLIIDVPPDRRGIPHKIILNKSTQEALGTIIDIREAIFTINNYFAF